MVDGINAINTKGEESEDVEHETKKILQVQMWNIMMYNKSILKKIKEKMIIV